MMKNLAILGLISLFLGLARAQEINPDGLSCQQVRENITTVECCNDDTTFCPVQCVNISNAEVVCICVTEDGELASSVVFSEGDNIDCETVFPTEEPTEATTESPTEAETDAPTEAETDAPTEAETDAPTEAETDAPTEAETDAPTEAETDAPTEAETDAPTENPTDDDEDTDSESSDSSDSSDSSESSDSSDSSDSSETSLSASASSRSSMSRSDGSKSSDDSSMMTGSSTSRSTGESTNRTKSSSSRSHDTTGTSRSTSESTNGTKSSTSRSSKSESSYDSSDSDGECVTVEELMERGCTEECLVDETVSNDGCPACNRDCYDNVIAALLASGGEVVVVGQFGSSGSPGVTTTLSAVLTLAVAVFAVLF